MSDVMLERVASMDGTNPVAEMMVPLDQQRAAYATETLEGVLDRTAAFVAALEQHTTAGDITEHVVAIASNPEVSRAAPCRALRG